MRFHSACRLCRERKQRCVIIDVVQGCTACAKSGRSCGAAQGRSRGALYRTLNSAEPTARRSPHNVEEVVLGENSVSPQSSLDLAPSDELVDLYFDLMHDKQHALFHRPSFISQHRANQVPSFLVFAMMALVARFSDSPYFQGTDRRERGREWAIQSRRLFDNRDTAVSLTAVQGCALLGNLAFIHGDSAMESLYGAQQIRMVQLLDLPHRLSSNVIQREVEIRVWWTTYMMDTWTSASVGLQKQLIHHPEYPRPMEEAVFEALSSGATSPSASQNSSEDGLWSQMIPLTDVLACITRLNNQAANNELAEDALLDQVRNLGSRLDHWEFCLPEKLKCNNKNAYEFGQKGLGRAFIALHSGAHYHSLSLYFQFLNFTPQQPNYKSIVTEYAQRCKDHATKLSQLLRLTFMTPGLECLWPIVGHLLVVASAVHLHSLLHAENEDEIATVKVLLEQNFEQLLQLQTCWPCLDWSVSRLQIFQRACQGSDASNFDLNHWLLHFLQKYALPIQEQDFATSPLQRPSVDIAWTPTELPTNATAKEILQTFL